jgi:hypothetical protein
MQTRRNTFKNIKKVTYWTTHVFFEKQYQDNDILN